MNSLENSWYPLPLAIATMCVSLIGVFGNLLIIIATLMNKSLRHRCNFLIAILAFADLIAGVYFVQLRIIILSGGFFWTNQKCFLWSFYGLIATTIQSGMGLALGVDRLLAIVQPIKYRHWNNRNYLPLLLLPVLTYSFSIVGFGYSQTTNNQSLAPPVCLPGNAFVGKSQIPYLISNLIIIFLVLFVYGTAHYKIRTLVFDSRAENTTMKHLLNSLSCVMIVYATCWTITFLALFVTIVLLPPNSPIARAIQVQIGWLVIIYTSSSAVFYAWRSEDYRKAFVSTLTCGMYFYDNGIKRKDAITLLKNSATN